MKDIVATVSIILAYIHGLCIALNCNIEFMLHVNTDVSFLNLTKVHILKIMNKKEFKIGETFQCGLVMLKCVKDESVLGRCDGCVFDDYGECLDKKEMAGRCSHTNRKDKQNVKFVKVEG